MAINNIKIKSHDIYLEKDNNKGGNLQIGNPNKLGSLTVYGNVNMTSPAISMSGANSVNINTSMSGANSVNINTPTLNVTGNVAMRSEKLSMWPTSIDIIESSNGSLNINTPTLSYNSSEERLVVTNLNIQGANIGVIPSESLCVTAIASINDGLKTTKITDELNIGANINNAGINLNGNIIQTNSSGEIFHNASSQMSITESIILKTNDITANKNSTVTIDNNSIVLKTKNENTNKYANLSIRSNSINLTASDASFNVTTSNFTINPESLNIKAPDIVVNTNKIDLIQNNSSTPINIDDLIKYTPSTIPTGFNKSWSYKKACDLSSVCNTDRTDFKTSTTLISGSIRTYYNIPISNSAEDLKDLNSYYKLQIPTIILLVQLDGESGFRKIELSKNSIKLSTSSLKIEASPSASTGSDFDKLAEIKKTGKCITSVTFMAIFNNLGEDAILSIDQCSTIQINNNKHVLLTCSSSTATTNISHFPNAVYSKDKERLIVQPVEDVTLYPGDFIEYYPITKSPCFLYSSTLMGGPESAVSSNGKPGYIYFNPNGDVFIQHSDNRYSTNTSTSSIQILFLVSAGWGAYSPVVIKK